MPPQCSSTRWAQRRQRRKERDTKHKEEKVLESSTPTTTTATTTTTVTTTIALTRMSGDTLEIEVDECTTVLELLARLPEFHWGKDCNIALMGQDGTKVADRKAPVLDFGRDFYLVHVDLPQVAGMKDRMAQHALKHCFYAWKASEPPPLVSDSSPPDSDPPVIESDSSDSEPGRGILGLQQRMQLIEMSPRTASGASQRQ